ncbi:MAG: hypothetical protein QXD48_02235 [Candidatus Aenigmatarchaeota archaeon]
MKIINKIFKNVKNKNPKYKNLLVGLLSLPLIFTLSMKADAQTKIRSHLSRSQVTRQVRFIKPPYIRLQPYLYSFYGYPYVFYYPESYLYKEIMIRQMFCYPPQKWYIQLDVKEETMKENKEIERYQKEIEKLKNRIVELEKKIEEKPREKKAYQPGYQYGGLMKGQYIGEAVSFLNWYLYNNGFDGWHAYTHRYVPVDDKKYIFDVVVEDEQNNQLCIFEFPDKEDAYEKNKMELIEYGKLKIPAYVIEPKDKGPDFIKQLEDVIYKIIK